MHDRRSVLLFGLDVYLLKTRCMVLRAAGFRVVAQSELSVLGYSLSDDSFDLLVFCHTVPIDDALLIITFARRLWPAAGAMRMTRGWRSHPAELVRAVTRSCEPSLPPSCSEFPFNESPPRILKADVGVCERTPAPGSTALLKNAPADPVKAIQAAAATLPDVPLSLPEWSRLGHEVCRIGKISPEGGAGLPRV